MPSTGFKSTKQVASLQYVDTSTEEKERVYNGIQAGLYPNTSIDHSFSYWTVKVEYAGGQESFSVEPGDVVVWGQKAVWHFLVDGTVNAHSLIPYIDRRAK